jgi:hypothetical protein
VAKTHQEIMEILEAFDLTRSYRAAAQLAGCDHKIVAHYVERRDTWATIPVGVHAGRGWVPVSGRAVDHLSRRYRLALILRQGRFGEDLGRGRRWCWRQVRPVTAHRRVSFGS